MTNMQYLIMIAVFALGTAATRFLPFLIFPANRPTPMYVRYLGRVLPSATIALLVVYCYKDIAISGLQSAAPMLIAGAITAGLHIWKRQMLLSIAAGTVSYMLLVQFVFI